MTNEAPDVPRTEVWHVMEGFPVTEDHEWAREILERLGGSLYAKIFGHDATFEAVPMGSSLEFEGITIKVKKPHENTIYVSNHVRRYLSKNEPGATLVGELDDFTVRKSTARGYPLQVERMASTLYVYAVLNKRETEFCRWHVLRILNVLDLYRKGKIVARGPYPNMDRRRTYLVVFELKPLRKLDLVFAEKLPPRVRTGPFSIFEEPD